MEQSINNTVNNTYEYRYAQSIKQLCDYYSIKRENIHVIYAEITLDVVRWKYIVKAEDVFFGYTGKFLFPNSTKEPFDKDLLKYLNDKGLITIINIV
jgi:hypothetical protein